MKAVLPFLLFLLKVFVALIIVNVLLPVGMVWGIVMLFRWSWGLLTPDSRYCRHCSCTSEEVRSYSGMQASTVMTQLR